MKNTQHIKELANELYNSMISTDYDDLENRFKKELQFVEETKALKNQA